MRARAELPLAWISITRKAMNEIDGDRPVQHRTDIDVHAAATYSATHTASRSAIQGTGIHAVYTSPQNLTVDTINKYLEVKARGLI